MDLVVDEAAVDLEVDEAAVDLEVDEAAVDREVDEAAVASVEALVLLEDKNDKLELEQ